MNKPDLGVLNERERDYLRLVQQGYSSKDIAQQENIRPDRVDKVINAARAKFANRYTRKHLARLLAEFEGRSAPTSLVDPAQSLGTQILPVADPSVGTDSAATTTAGAQVASIEPNLEHASGLRRPTRWHFGPGPEWSDRNDLGVMRSSAMIGFVAALAALIAGGVASLYNALNLAAAAL